MNYLKEKGLFLKVLGINILKIQLEGHYGLRK